MPLVLPSYHLPNKNATATCLLNPPIQAKIQLPSPSLKHILIEGWDETIINKSKEEKNNTSGRWREVYLLLGDLDDVGPGGARWGQRVGERGCGRWGDKREVVVGSGWRKREMAHDGEERTQRLGWQGNRGDEGRGREEKTVERWHAAMNRMRLGFGFGKEKEELVDA